MPPRQSAAAAASTSATPSHVPAAYPVPYGNPFTSLSHSIEKLDGSMASGKSNYVAWKFWILRILKEKGLAHTPRDGGAPDDAVDQVTAERMNDQAFTIISLNIHDSQI